jgi:N-methylhydantoinase A
MRLDPARAEQTIDTIANRLGLPSEQAALGIIKIVNAHMARAIRLVSVARGHDPRDFTLVSFGGAGGLHACDVAREVGIVRVLIPRGASTLSAYGMLAADVAKDFVRTVMLPATTPYEKLAKLIKPMVEVGRSDIKAQGFAPEHIEIVRELDLRYAGQSYELQVPFEPAYAQTFHERHQETYGYSDPDMPVEVVNLKVRAVGRVPKLDLVPAPLGSKDPAHAWLSESDGALNFYDGDGLKPGNQVSGECIILFPDTTVYLRSLDSAKVDGFGNLLVTVGRS